MVVTNAAGASTAFNVTVATVAPSIFDLDGKGLAAVVKNADFSLVTASNRGKGRRRDRHLPDRTGQTTPAVQTGALVIPPSGGFNNTGAVTVTIGGVSAPVSYSIASPVIRRTVPDRRHSAGRASAAMRRSSSLQGRRNRNRHSFGTVTHVQIQDRTGHPRDGPIRSVAIRLRDRSRAAPYGRAGRRQTRLHHVRLP